MLTARNQERDEVRGLSLGADDYVTKPFNFAKLLARVEALLRRSSLGMAENSRMMYQDPIITIDLWRRQVSVRGHLVDLSPTEYRLLLTMVRYYGQVLSHEQLLLEVWGPNYDSVASVKAYISYLRRKIERYPDDPELIHTCWGIGYRYEVLGHAANEEVTTGAN
jgi:two-component system KDP operon response regulator KdpE